MISNVKSVTNVFYRIRSLASLFRFFSRQVSEVVKDNRDRETTVASTQQRKRKGDRYECCFLNEKLLLSFVEVAFVYCDGA